MNDERFYASEVEGVAIDDNFSGSRSRAAGRVCARDGPIAREAQGVAFAVMVAAIENDIANG